jgi:hypothetical protein
MRVEVTVEIAAGAPDVWAVVADVERWPRWNPAVRRVRPLDAGPLAVGPGSRRCCSAG